jgi:hypothetical protein
MSSYRSAALAAAACAVSLAVAACTAGITTVTRPATRTPSTSAPSTSAPAPARSASVAAAASAPASAGRMITIGGSADRFPVPAGAKVASNMGDGQSVEVFFSMVTPENVSSFYATALPRAGYTISINSVVTENGDTAAIINFSGHGYKGTIDAETKALDPGLTIPGLGTKNVTTILLMPK